LQGSVIVGTAVAALGMLGTFLLYIMRVYSRSSKNK